MKKCVKCGNTYPDSYDECPYCNSSVEITEQKFKNNKALNKIENFVEELLNKYLLKKFADCFYADTISKYKSYLIGIVKPDLSDLMKKNITTMQMKTWTLLLRKLLLMKQ